jgi:hypothetical protein
MRHYATCADAGYLGRLRVLVASMRRHCRPFVLHVLIDDDCLTWCLQQPELKITRISSFLREFPEMDISHLPGPMRTRPDERLCTWRWTYFRDLLEDREPDFNLTCIDADVMFWSPPDPVFEEIGSARVAVLPHNRARATEGVPGVSEESHGYHGLYNGGFVYLADQRPAADMAELTRQWCYAGMRTHDNGRQTYGDQGYLEIIQEDYAAHVIEHRGACAGPWSLNRKGWELERRDGVLELGGRPLVSFHYQGFRWARACSPAYALSPEAEELLYPVYREELVRAGDAKRDPDSNCNECGGQRGFCPHAF